MSKEENKEYEESLKVYRDLQNSLDTARMEGEVKGRAEGMIEMCKTLIKEGCDIAFIKRVTGLSDDQINTLRPELA